MKIIYKIKIFSLLILFSSCDFLLDITPEDTLQEGDIKETHVESLVRGVYNTLADCPTAGLILNDCRGEIIESNPNTGSVANNDFSRNNFTADNSFVESYYYYLYSVIHQANYVMDYLDKADPDKENVSYQQMIGSLHYIRAYSYFTLVNAFGGIPIVTEVTEEVIPRSPASEVWAQIKSDLNVAIQKCRKWDEIPPEYDAAPRPSYFASSEAAEALLARVYLYTKEYAKAKLIARTFIEDSRFAMATASTIAAVAVGVGPKELIMCILNPSGVYYYRRLFNTYGMTPAGSYQFRPTTSFSNSFNTSDSRYSVCLATSVDGLPTVNKFNYNSVSTCPFTISRFTEMYLIFAECSPDLDGLEKLNYLRQQRNLPVLDRRILDDPEKYVEAILDERKYEFYGENHYFYDLVRLNKVFDRLTYTKDEYRLLLPIPQSQVNLGLKQNPGYF